MNQKDMVSACLELLSPGNRSSREEADPQPQVQGRGERFPLEPEDEWELVTHVRACVCVGGC